MTDKKRTTAEVLATVADNVGELDTRFWRLRTFLKNEPYHVTSLGTSFDGYNTAERASLNRAIKLAIKWSRANHNSGARVTLAGATVFECKHHPCNERENLI